MEYLAMLRNIGISYVVSGESAVDLVRAVNLLGEHFGIRRLLLEGGGQSNGAFLDAVFDGVTSRAGKAAPLRLKSVERRQNDTLWLRYEAGPTRGGN